MEMVRVFWGVGVFIQCSRPDVMAESLQRLNFDELRILYKLQCTYSL